MQSRYLKEFFSKRNRAKNTFGLQTQGWIKEEQFEKTRPMVEGMRNDLSKALQTSSPLSEQKLRSYQEADGFIPPDRLVPLVTMRAKVTNTDMSTVKSLKNAEKAVNEMKSVAETSKKK